MQLYYFSLSPYSRKVLITLNEKNIDVQLKHIDLFSNDKHERDKLAALKQFAPLGILPVLVNNDDVITESNNIIEYLELGFGIRLIPLEKESARVVRYWSAVSDQYVIEPARRLFAQSQLDAKQRDEKIVNRANEMLQIMYAQIEKQLQYNQGYVALPDFTMADCAIYSGLTLSRRLCEIPAEYGYIQTYIKSIGQRASVVALRNLRTQ